MTDKSVWNKEIPVPERMIQYIDQGVIDSKPNPHPNPQLQNMVTQPPAQNFRQEPSSMGSRRVALRTGRGPPG